MSDLELFQHPLFVASISTILGASLTGLVLTIRNRMARIVYYTTITPIGTSAVDPVFGTIRVSWNNNELNNLFLIQLAIENNSSRDIENLHLKVYVDNDTRVLGERSSMEGTSFILPWAQEFRDQISIPDGGAPTEPQTFFYFHNREYRLDAFNRFQRAEVDLLCTRPSSQTQPNAFLETKSKGVRIRRTSAPVAIQSRILGVPVQRAALAGIIVTMLVAVISVLFISPVWLAVLIPTAAGLFGQVVGALTSKAIRGLRLLFVR